jgi:hypothetical protein
MDYLRRGRVVVILATTPRDSRLSDEDLMPRTEDVLAAALI